MLADYQLAYNGIKVRIDRSKLDGLEGAPGVAGVRASAAHDAATTSRACQLIGAPSVWEGLAVSTAKASRSP